MPGRGEHRVEAAGAIGGVHPQRPPAAAKIEVNGDGAGALYKLLKSEQPGADGKEDIPWNFTKFLVHGSGNVVARFAPQTTPEEIARDLPRYL